MKVKKLFKVAMKYLGGLVVILALILAFLPVQSVSAAANHYLVMGQVYIANVTGVITEAGRNVADATMHVTTEGTFTFSMANGTSCVLTSGTSVVTGSPQTLALGSNAVTCTGTGTIDFNITIGTAANWDTVNSWSLASGGACGAAVPTSADNTYFNANSFTAGSQVLTVDATASCLSMDWTGSTNTPDLKFNAFTLNLYGSATFIAAMTNSAGYRIYLAGSGVQSITSNGLANLNFFEMAGTGTMNLIDALNCRGFRINSGTLTTNNFNMTMSGGTYSTGFGITGAGAKTINLGSSTITTDRLTNSSSNTTLNAGTSTFNITGVGQTLVHTGGLTYNIVNLQGAAHTLTGNGTFATLGLTRAGVQTITFTDGTTQTISNLTRDAGVSIKTLQGSGAAGWGITYAGATYVSQDYFSISRSNALPAVNKFYAGTHSTNGGNNTGWNFYAPDSPSVTVQAATDIHAEDAVGNGTVTNLGAGNINTLANGFDWGIVSTVYTGSVTGAGSGLAAFFDTLTSLPIHTTIYYRAKSQNSIGWGYSAETSFITVDVGVPTNFEVNANGKVTWTKGTYATGTVIVRGTGSYPTTTSDGVIIYSGIGITTTDQNPNPDSVTYYYSAWGINGTHYSPTYATTSAGGAAVAAIGNYIFYGIIMFMAIVLTVASYAVKRTALATLSAIIWMVVCGVSLSQLSTNIPVYTAMALIGFIAAIGMSIQAYGFRDKDEEGSEDDSDLTFEEQLKRNDTARAEEKAKRDADSLNKYTYKSAKRKAKDEGNYFGQ